jgi:hypothetical protein
VSTPAPGRPDRPCQPLRRSVCPRGRLAAHVSFGRTISHVAYLSLLLILPSTVALAQSAPDTTYQVPFRAERIDLPRSANGIAYRLLVRKPLREPEPGERAIAIYLLDAQWNLPAVATMEANYEVLGRTPPIYFVGVGYQDEAAGKPLESNRTRDYTPTAFSSGRSGPSLPQAGRLRGVGRRRRLSRRPGPRGDPSGGGAVSGRLDPARSGREVDGRLAHDRCAAGPARSLHRLSDHLAGWRTSTCRPARSGFGTTPTSTSP